MSSRGRDLARGWAAWRSGRVEEAVSVLAPLAERAPLDADAVYPWARALHEIGRSQEALAALTTCLEQPGTPSGAYSHRALVLWDLGEEEALAADLARLGEDSQMTPALRALSRLRNGDDAATFPPFALWNAEVAGRLLALMETRYLSNRDPASDEFHHRLWSTEPAAPDDAAGLEVPEAFSRPREWIATVDACFAARRFSDVARLAALDTFGRRPPAMRPLQAYAWWATKDGARAARRIAADLAAEGPDFDLWFLLGLAETRAGRSVAASAAFVRAMRLDDVVLHGVLIELAREVGLPFASGTPSTR